MKKLLVAIFALLYISTSVGATVQMHYCMGKLADWGLTHNKSGTCGKCGMEETEKKQNGCCKDEQKFLKNDTDQKTPESSLQLMQLMGVALPVSFFEIPAVDIPTIPAENHIGHAPPRGNSVAVYIRNCVFLI